VLSSRRHARLARLRREAEVRGLGYRPPLVAVSGGKAIRRRAESRQARPGEGHCSGISAKSAGRATAAACVGTQHGARRRRRMSARSPSRARTLLLAVAVASTGSKKRAIRSETEASRDPVLAARHGGSATCTVRSHEPCRRPGTAGHITTLRSSCSTEPGGGGGLARRLGTQERIPTDMPAELTKLQSCAAVPSIAVRPAQPCSRG
jgi:hypothetical protein